MLGSVALKPIPFVLKEIHQDLKSGELILKKGNEQRIIYFKEGNIAHISSFHSTEKLGLFLVKENIINEEKLKEVINFYKEGQLFGEFLVSMNVIDKNTLEENLKNYHAYLLTKILFWEDGAFIFNEKFFEKDKRFIDISFANLILKASRFLNDESTLRKFFGEDKHFLCFSPNPINLLQNLSLEPEEFFILSRIKGVISLQELLSICSNIRIKVLRLTFALLISGVLEALNREEALERQMEAERISTSLLNIAIEAKEEYEESLPERIRQKRDFIKSLKEKIKEVDYYKLFNLSPGATIQDIYQRYLEYMRIVHPDNSFQEGLKDLREDMLEISSALLKAYQILSNPHSRANYDLIYKGEKSLLKEDLQRKMLQKDIAQKNFEKAKEYMAAEDYHSALKLLEEAYRFDPDNSEILLSLVNLETKNPNWIKRASDRLIAHLENNPELEEGWLVLSTIYLSRGMVQKAKACVQKVIELNKDNERAKRVLEELEKKEKKG